jgi:Protein of unknown function (DUF2877)
VATREVPCAASSLTDALFDGDVRDLVEVVRTRVSVHYETFSADLPVLCVCTPAAVRLPSSVVAAELPAPGRTRIGAGGLRVGDARWVPRRWWSPSRPHGLARPADPTTLAGLPRPVPLPGLTLPGTAYDGLRPDLLVGAGPGLTPAGDDVLAAALVTARAVGDGRTRTWQQLTRAALTARSTTAVSRAMLHHALDGYATPELAGFLEAVCRGDDLTAPLHRLLGVGHSSGAALLAGVVHTLTTHEMRGAA